MPIDSGGNITRPPSPIPVSGQTADAPQVNVPIDDIYASLNQLAFLDGRKALRGNIPMNGHRAVGAGNAVAPQDYVTLAQLQAALSGAATVPTGVIMAHTGVAAPAGWVLANGAALSRATFPNLWAFAQASGNLAGSEASKQDGQYGPGNGSTTFTLPNLSSGSGRFVRSTATGRAIGTSQANAFGSHTHTGTTSTAGAHTHPVTIPASGSLNAGANPIVGPATTSISFNTGSAGNHSHTFTTAATGGTETRPDNVAYPFIIKA